MTGIERIVERLRRMELRAHHMPSGVPKQALLDDCHNMRLLVELANVAVEVCADEGAGWKGCPDPACTMCRMCRQVEKVQREGE